MTQYRYHSQVQEGPRTQFREATTPGGLYALAGASGRQAHTLAERLTPLQEAVTAPTADGFEAIITDFLSWFRQAYEEKNGSSCPYADEEIVEGVGLFWADATGKAVCISAGNFQFAYLHDNRIHPVPVGFQALKILPGLVLIADPNRSDAALVVSKRYREGGNQWSALTNAPMQPAIGLVWAEPIRVETPLPLYEPPAPSPTPPGPRTWGGVPVLIVSILAGLIAGLIWVGYNGWLPFQNTMQTATVDSTALVTDSTQLVVADTVTIPDAAPAPPRDTLPTPVVEPNNTVVDSDTSRTDTTPDGPDTTRPIVQKKEKPRPQSPTVVDSPARQYLSAATAAFERAEKLRAAGKAQNAYTEYQSALASYTRYTQLAAPQNREAIKRQMEQCKQFIQLYKSQSAF